jgi:hypothetical protein
MARAKTPTPAKKNDPPKKKGAAKQKEPAAKKKAAAKEKEPGTGRALPPALRERADAMKALGASNLAAAARAALESARGAFRESSRGMYELGKALAELRKPGMAEAAGHDGGFGALVAKEFELHPQTAERLVRAVSHVSEEMFSALGPRRVNALLDLATVTEADDTHAILTGEVVRLWKKGPKVNVSKAPTAKIIEHTKAARARLLTESGKKPRGRSATPAEREAADEASKRLHHQGIAATVKVRATKPGAPSEFDIVGLDRRELEALTQG